MDTIFLTFMEQKRCLEQLKLCLSSVKSERMPRQESTRRGKRQEKRVRLMRRGPGRPRRPPYLSLQHQLFGEPRGLVAEGFRHLHSAGRIPGTAWTFDTCGRQRRQSEVSTAAAPANHDSGGGCSGKSSAIIRLSEIKKIIHRHLRVATEVKRSEPKLFRQPI